MKHRNKLLLGIVLVGGAFLAVVGYAEKHKAPRLPDAVTKAIAKDFTGYKIEEVERETEGIMVYEVELEASEDNELEAAFTEDGGLVTVESELKADQLPPAVAAALPAGAEVKEAEHIQTFAEVVLVPLEQPKTSYEVKVLLDGKMVELQISSDGSVVKQVVEADDDHDDDHGKADDDDDDDDANGGADDDDAGM